MSTQPYTVLKYSEYLRTELPAHWLEKRLGYLSMQVRNAFVDGPFGSDLKTTDYQDEGVPLIQLNNIRDSKHVLQNMKFISEEKRNQLKRHIAKPKDVVFAKMADPVARSAVVANDFPEYVIVADCVKMTPNLALANLNFLVWAINSDCVRINAELVSTGTTRVRISLGDLQKLKIPYPPINEQQAIARFLDHETAKIDALIEKQQRLIELLKEKRQAVISHAVTKGLNPNAPMKDSGVEWLGEVPAHWEVLPIKYLSDSIGTGGTPKSELSFAEEPEIFWFTPGDFSVQGQLIFSAKHITNRAVANGDVKAFRAGSVLIIGIGATLGKVALCESDFSCNQQINVVTPNSKVKADFLMNSLLVQAEQMKQSSNFSTIGIMNQEKTKQLVIAVPPLDEQAAVARFLDEKKVKFDAIEAQALNQIALLQERRTALISAVVTGKIDVRDWQAAA